MTRRRDPDAPAAAEAEPFDPADPAPFAALAGKQLVRVDGDTAVVRTQDGAEMTVRAGWLAVVPDGGLPGKDTVFAEPRNLGGPLSDWVAA